MTTKVGILSDKHHKEHCLEYMASMSQGYFNAVYRGDIPNPNYPGIKSCKYQRAPLKPAHLIDYATNMARLQGGNIANNARNTIDTVKPDMINFVNKPIFPMVTTPATGVVGVPPVLPTTVGPSIGNVMSTQTFGTAEVSTQVTDALSGLIGTRPYKSPMARYQQMYSAASEETQRQILDALDRSSPGLRLPSGKSKMRNISTLLSEDNVRAHNIDLDAIFGASPSGVSSSDDDEALIYRDARRNKSSPMRPMTGFGPQGGGVAAAKAIGTPPRTPVGGSGASGATNLLSHQRPIMSGGTSRTPYNTGRYNTGDIFRSEDVPMQGPQGPQGLQGQPTASNSRRQVFPSS